jgi:hypothetical protein
MFAPSLGLISRSLGFLPGSCEVSSDKRERPAQTAMSSVSLKLEAMGMVSRDLICYNGSSMQSAML